MTVKQWGFSQVQAVLVCNWNFFCYMHFWFVDYSKSYQGSATDSPWIESGYSPLERSVTALTFATVCWRMPVLDKWPERSAQPQWHSFLVRNATQPQLLVTFNFHFGLLNLLLSQTNQALLSCTVGCRFVPVVSLTVCHYTFTLVPGGCCLHYACSEVRLVQVDGDCEWANSVQESSIAYSLISIQF